MDDIYELPLLLDKFIENVVFNRHDNCCELTHIVMRHLQRMNCEKIADRLKWMYVILQHYTWESIDLCGQMGIFTITRSGNRYVRSDNKVLRRLALYSRCWMGEEFSFFDRYKIIIDLLPDNHQIRGDDRYIMDSLKEFSKTVEFVPDFEENNSCPMLEMAISLCEFNTFL